MKKYELVKEDKINYSGRTLYRIRSLITIDSIPPNMLGGYIEKENNLSHFGNAWVSSNARVYGDARVYDNARVYGNAWVYGDAQVSSNTQVRGFSEIMENYHCKNITGFSYNITVTPMLISVGCRDFTPDELDNFYDDVEEHEQGLMKIVIESCLEDIYTKMSLE